MRQNKGILIAVSAAVFAAAFFAVSMKSSAQQKKYVFIAPTVKELADSSLGKMLSEITVALSQKVGMDIQMQRPVYSHGGNATKMTLDAMKANKAQMGYVNAIEYIMLEKKYPKVFDPKFTLTFDNKKNKDTCFYVKKDSPVTDVKGTKGLVWGGEDTYQARLLLHENGYDGALSGWFKKVKFVSSSPVTKGVEAIMNGDIDVFSAERAMMKMSGGMSSGDASGKQVSPLNLVKEVGCALYENTWVFGSRGDMPDEDKKKIAAAMIGANKDKAFQKFQFMFIAIKGSFVPFKDSDYARTREIVSLINKYGWEKEKDAFNKTVK